MNTLIVQLPFSEEDVAAAEAADQQVEHLYIYFLDQKPEQTQVDDICRSYDGPDILRMGEKEIYLLCHQSIRKSTLSNDTAKIFNLATVRNWKTVKKLYDMLVSDN